MSDLEKWQRRAARDRKARVDAERMLERKSLQLYKANQELISARDEMEARVEQRTLQLSETNRKLKEQMQDRESLHQKLIELSHQAGKAEISAGVLHNVGNVLNSVNISADVCISRLRKSRCTTLQRASDMLMAHAENLVEFLTEDERGKRLPEFLHYLSLAMTKEQQELLDELGELRTNIDHIKDIVHAHQSSARMVSVIEPIQLVDVIEKSIKIIESSLAKHRVEVQREFQSSGAVHSDRQKLLQILINLLRNAMQAVRGTAEPNIKIAIRDGEGQVFVEITDNGEGIAEQNMAKIFTYGFTTKADGHGFGLHSCSLVAQQLGGAIQVESRGAGCGATFTLVLPRQHNKRDLVHESHCAPTLEPLITPTVNGPSPIAN